MSLDDTRPAPMVPAEVDLRDFSFMPLDVLRLRDSELASSPDAEVFRCAVLSWCVAWHQVPAASLPDDDVLLARLLGFGRDVKGWKRVRSAGGLRGWVQCSDGRLYHEVVAEKALQVWKESRVRAPSVRQPLDVSTWEWARLRRQVFERDNFTCRYCGERRARFAYGAWHPDRLHCDHILPRALGGPSTLENLATACPACNISKGAKRVEEWRA